MNIYSKLTGNRIGFTMLELMISMGIVLLLTTLAIPSYRTYQYKSDLGSQVDEFVGQISLAREKTISSDVSSSWGIRISTSTVPQKIIMFNGNSYNSRDASADIITDINEKVIVAEADFAGEDWVVFKRVTGQASTTGYITLELALDPSYSETVYLNQEGVTDLAPFSPPASGRITDSRHIHLLYTRTIDTANDHIELYVDGLVIADEIITIGEYLEDGQFVWSGEVENEDGSIQELAIRTHELNNPDTVFSIHRERHLNERPLGVHILNDSALRPNLINYGSSGTWATGSSIFVNLITEQ